MDCVLMGHQQELPVAGPRRPFPGGGGHPEPALLERFDTRSDRQRALQVLGELAGEHVVDRFPGHAGPAGASLPFREPGVVDHVDVVVGRKYRGGLPGAKERRAHDDGDRPVGHVPAGSCRLLFPDGGQPVSRQVAIYHVMRVLDLAVAHEVDKLWAHPADLRSRYRACMSGFDTPFAHIDMDAFYVEVERLDDPTLHGVPVVVGGLGGRGVVSSASYEARRHGVRSAMPIGEARRRLPHARYLSPDMAKYTAISRKVFAILDEFSPHVEPLSVDEAFIDISGLRLHYASPREVAVAMRRRIREELALPASVGIAAVKFLAKMASKEAKPDGLLVIPRGDEPEFLGPRPVAELWGVGTATLAALDGLGIETIGQLARFPEDVLRRHLGAAAAAHLSDLAASRDPRSVDTGRLAKSISVESTFSVDLREGEAIETALLELCHRLSARLLHAAAAGRTVNLKIRFADFTTLSRSHTTETAVADTSQLWPIASGLLGRIDLAGRGVRLLGIGVASLGADEPAQLALDGSDRTALAEAASEVRGRFGDDAVLPARLAKSPPRNPGE